MPATKTDRPSLAGLTSLRFFAAAFVLLFHTRGQSPFFACGFTGVTLFFVLSGFILAYNHPTIAPEKRKSFYLARFARIYPLYLVSFVLSLFFWWPTARTLYDLPFMISCCVLFLLVMHAWYPPMFFQVNAGAWTLVVEFFFYALFPFLLAPMARLQKHWKLAVLGFYLLLLLPSSFYDLYGKTHLLSLAYLMYLGLRLPIFHLGEFLIGMTLGVRFLRHRPQFSGCAVTAALVVVLTWLAISVRILPSCTEMIFNGFMALPYALLIYTIAGWQSPWFGHPVLQLGGEISFSLYLLQLILVESVQTLFHHSQRFLPLRFGLILFGAYLSYRFIEKPARSWVLKKFSQKSHTKPIETPGVAIP